MKIYLDDIRNPRTDMNWTIVRSYCEFVDLIEKLTPDQLKDIYISFDHDLGDSQTETGYDAAKWLVNYYLDHNIDYKINFNVHLANPVGAMNIKKLFENFNTINGHAL